MSADTASKNAKIGRCETPGSPVALIDIDKFVLSKALIQANSGGGKSMATRLMCERIGAHVPVAVLDIEGEFHTLREVMDVLLVGPDADMAPHVETAGPLAIRLLETGVSAVIDLYEFSKDEQREYVRRFVETMVAAPKRLWSPRLVIIDEAHEMAPEGGKGEASQAVVDLMSKGRKRQYCPILCTQRISKLSKDAAAEANNVFIGRCTLDLDQKRAGDTLGLDRAENRKLRELAGGVFHAYGPALNFRGVELMKFDMPKSTHGKEAMRSAVLSPSAAMRKSIDELKDLAERAKTEVMDIDAARNRIAELERELTTNGPAIAGAAETIERLQGNAEELGKALEQSTAEVGRLKAIATAQWDSIQECSRWIEAQKGRIHAAHGLLTHAENEPLPLTVNPADCEEFAPPDPGPTVGSVSAAIDRIPSSVRREPATLRIAQPSRPRPAQSEGGIPGPHQKILNSLAWWESVGVAAPTAAQVAFVAGYSPGTGTMNTYFGAMVSAGLIVRDRGIVQLTPDGHKHAERPQRRPTLQALHEQLRGVLDGPCGKVLDAVIARHGRPAPADEIAKDAGYSPGTGTMNTYFGRMTSLGLITRNRGVVAPTEVVFPPALVRRTA
jgi:hypothetical protein